MKRLASFLIVAVLLVGILPMAALAEGAEEPVVLKYYRSALSDAYIDPSIDTFQRLRQVALEQANVDLQIEYYDWGENARQKLTMHAAAGDLPSGVWTLEGVSSAFATEIINKMGMRGMLYDWSEVILDAENYPTLAANAEAHFLQMATCPEDGKIYGLPSERHGAYPHAPGGITLRKDWLENLGLSFPTNEEELYQVIKAFKENYVSESGREIAPVSFPKWDNFTYFLNSWLGTSMWYEEDGAWNYEKYAKQEELSDAIGFLNRLWNEGLLDKESFTQTGEQFVTKGANGSFGVTTFSYTTVYNINDALYAAAPDTNQYFVSAPTFSCYPGTPVESVHSMELTSVPFNRTVVTTNGIDEATFKRLAKAIDWIGTYDASLMLLMGFEGSEWEREEGTDRKIRTQAWTDNVNKRSNYQYNAGLCYWSSLNSNIDAMYDLLAAICVRKSDVESVANIKGHQIALSDPMNIVSAGPIETEKWNLINDAWEKMVVAAVSAETAEACQGILAAWPDQLRGLGYEEIVSERIATCENYGLKVN